MTEQTTGLWTPWSERESRYNIPSNADLKTAWCDGELGDSLVELEQNILGTAETPTSQPSVVLSVDLCEVVRKTGASVAAMRGGTIDDIYIAETDNFDYGASFNGWHEETAQPNKQLYLQEFMHHELVEPEDFSEVMQAFLLRWKNDGAYIIANTSTLPGCEISTVKFLQKHFSGCFNGVLFPRNHDGNGSTTKAGAISSLMNSIEQSGGFTISTLPTIAIEDAPHHANDYNDAGITTFLPAYDWNKDSEGLANATRVDRSQFGTLGTFIAVDQHLNTLQ